MDNWNLLVTWLAATGVMMLIAVIFLFIGYVAGKMCASPEKEEK